MSRTPLAMCVAGTLWAAALVAAIWTVPFYTLDSGVPGVQPRITLSAAAAAGLGDHASLPALPIAAFMVALVLAMAATALVLLARRRRSRRLAGAAVVASVTLFLLAGAEFVTIFVDVYVMPAAALLLAGSTGVVGQVREVEPHGP
ncbi:hypothetical protein [Oryzihumus sp.]